MSSRDTNDADLRRAIALVRAVRDPSTPGLLFLCMLAATGFVMVALGWRGAAALPYVPLQMPFVVSSSIAGVALVATGAVLAAVLGERRDGAHATAEMNEVVTGLTALVRSATRNRPGTEG